MASARWAHEWRWRRRAIGLALAIALLAQGGCAGLPVVSAEPWAIPVPVSAPATSSDTPMVVWLSGDGGWGKMEREATRRLAAAGAPTLGVDSLRFFSTRRDPKVAAAEIAEVTAAYAARWGRRRVVLAGFSFGANIGPFILRDLPDDLRNRVVLAAFLSPAKRVNIQVGPASWMGVGLGPEVWPVMSRLQPTPVLCIGGAGVFADICPDAGPPAGMHAVRLGGGHTLTNQYDEIVRLILTDAGA